MFNFFHKKKTENEKSLDKPGSEAEASENLEDSEWEKDIAVHTMPEKFRSSHTQVKQAKNVGLIIMIGGALFLLIVLAGLYFFLLKTKTSEKISRLATSTTPAETGDTAITPPQLTSPTTPASAPQLNEKPKEVFLKMRAEIGKAEDYEDYKRVLKKYGSGQRIAELEEESGKVSQLTEEKRGEFMDLMKQSLSQPIVSVKETVKGGTAKIFITINERDIIAEAVLENDEWKINSEGALPLAPDSGTTAATLDEWLQKALKSIKPSAGDFAPGLDNDQDGLTDKEEDLLGSDLDNSDSDGDGYNDLAEVMSMYNPAGAGELKDNANIKEYTNSTYEYNFLHPADWIFSQVGGDDSIMFKSPNNQFLQVIVQPNDNRQSIEDWFGAQFGEAAIIGSKVISADTWRGIKSDDGLIIYLTDGDFTNIYVITYNLGESDVLEYINIFEMAVKSFRL